MSVDFFGPKREDALDVFIQPESEEKGNETKVARPTMMIFKKNQAKISFTSEKEHFETKTKQSCKDIPLIARNHIVVNRK